MARGGHRALSQVQPALPKVEYEKVAEMAPMIQQPRQILPYGYNDGADFDRPDSYIRYIEPLESDLATQVEYDMDEQDQAWLDSVNLDRKKDNLTRISPEVFEITMDRLEKEWFDLTKHIPQIENFALPSEDSTCAICDDSEGENSNAIVFCDGCNLAVHQDCYGVPYIPEGQWLCRKCTVSPENPVSCVLCPNEGGAFKQTESGDWVHLLCAIWIPETRVLNETFMEPVTGMDEITKSRWKLKCSICENRGGACIQCSRSQCYSAFHATCARQEKLLLPMKTTPGAPPTTLTAYCDKHLPPDQAAIRLAALSEMESPPPSPSNSKAARAHTKSYKAGPPLVPAVIVNRVLQYISRLSVTKPYEFVCLMCRYWSLKREARRGAPLLKRLHLEPWAGAGDKPGSQNDEDRVIKLEQLRMLRNDLAQIRELVVISRQRERRKLTQIEIKRDVLNRHLLSHEKFLRIALTKIESLDRTKYFKDPVSKIIAPDYYDVITQPMCWSMIGDKIDGHEYWNLQEFKDDLDLVFANAKKYNKKDTPIHKSAERIQNNIEPIIKELECLEVDHPSTHINGDTNPRALIGDLEPPLGVVDTLFTSDSIQDGYSYILETDPITSIFSLEHGIPKPPPEPRSKKRKGKSAQKSVSDIPDLAPSRTSSERLTITLPRRSKTIEASVPPAPEEVQTALYPSVAPVHSPSKVAPISYVSEEPPIPLIFTSVLSPSSFDAATGQVASTRSSAKRRSSLVVSPRSPKLEPPPDQPIAGPSTEPPDSAISNKPATSRRTPPIFVEEVTDKTLFTHFDTGHILADNMKRTTRVPRILQDREIRPLPKKKVNRQSAPKSETLPQEVTNGIPQNVEDYTPSELLIELRRTTRGNATKEDVAEVAELSSSISTRRQTRVAKAKIENDADEAQTESTRRTRRKSQPTVPLEDRKPALAEDEPSEESESGSDMPKKKKRPKQERIIDRGMFYLDGKNKLPGGELVWAKLGSYPWWPAVIFEEDDKNIELSPIKKVYDENMEKNPTKLLHIVQFFDANKSWSVLELSKLRQLGEDKVLDAHLLAEKTQTQKWKTRAIWKQCCDAFQEATSEMETVI